MGDIQTRPFSKNYSGLINQSVIAFAITVAAVSAQELMKRARRGKNPPDGLGSRESWEFGYLYQGRSWAKIPSPPTPRGWILSWVPQALSISQEEMHSLRGVDASLYIRWLRGCFYFVLLHTLTTFPILFPIHVEFSEGSVSPKSMTRASIASLVQTAKGRSLLWIHICLLFWVTLTWIATLFWIVHGAFMLRAADIREAVRRKAKAEETRRDKFYPHPHPQYPFIEVLPEDNSHTIEGLRHRTVMVSNLLPQLRNEKELKEYFEYYMSRHLDRPVLPGVAANEKPGFVNKSLAFLFNHAKRLPAVVMEDAKPAEEGPSDDDRPIIERVVVCRKMTELASLLERREDVLRLLETAHLKLAKNVLLAVKEAIKNRDNNKPLVRRKSFKEKRKSVDPEKGTGQDGVLSEEQRMDQLINILGPFVTEFGLMDSSSSIRKQGSRDSKHLFRKLRQEASQDSDDQEDVAYPSSSPKTRKAKLTIWEALLQIPRESLDPYQPLLRLSHLFRDKAVPAIDYYTAKLNLLTSLIVENRSRPVNKFDPVSTAFVTFSNPDDARKACLYLTVHPNNPLACMVEMAPPYQDLDWIRIMKSSYHTEFLKDWVVSLGVWTFTIFWLFPVSFLVGLVSIQNISTFWPSLKAYLDQHPWEEEVIQSFVPTLLVSLLALLIPMILLLIAKKAHTITTLSALHDRIMTRYHKFLIINILIFFCVGTAALQSVLTGFKTASSAPVDILQIVADSFPTAGPFYVGWLIFTVAMHGGFELALFGLPLIMYPSTRSQVTPRKRVVGTRPRTFNFYYWVPTHVLVIHVLLLFSVLNPFVLPFGAIYFFVETGVVKNQLVHVYAKQYEGNGKLILIRLVRYTLDGLILSQAVFLAYMVVLKKNVNVGLAALLIIFTAFTKIFMTRMCRAQFDQDDIIEARILCDTVRVDDLDGNGTLTEEPEPEVEALLEQIKPPPHASRLTWRVPDWMAFSWSSVRNRAKPHDLYRRPIPFRSYKGPSSPITPISPSAFPRSDTTKAEYNPSAINQKWENQHNKPVEKESIIEDHHGPVVPHDSPRPWDDQTTMDLPYDNPYYTRTINNSLWLPRDPFGKLNLDDTVDLKTSITVEPPAAPLGTWKGVKNMTSSPLSLTTSQSTLPEVEGFPYQEDVDGTEDIDLPPAIAQRVSDGDVETIRPRRNSSYRARISKPSLNSVASSAAGSHAHTYPHPRSPAPGFRSFSDGTPPRPPRPRTSSLLSAFEPHLHRAATTLNQEPGIRPDIQAQAEFVAANPSSSRISLETPKHPKKQNISAQHAIVHEVMAEEEDAFVERIGEEAAEAEKATATRSWITSWMFERRASEKASDK